VSVAAALVGWLIAGTVAAPVSRLTRAAEEVGSSGRLDVDVPGTGADEVGRLGAAFRNMLGALAVSRAEQQRLVQDAGHELRTPLTSLKTNLSVLRRHPEMSSDMRDGVLDDLDSEVTELTDLVNELVAVASGELGEQPAERIELAALARDVAERVGRRRSRNVVVEVRNRSSVDAPRAALDRAVTNLVDNACKFDQSGGPIEVVVDGGSLTVFDRGPGIPPGEEERIFDRFHRSEAARSMPGSGLGLSIVRDVITNAGGTVSGTRARAAARRSASRCRSRPTGRATTPPRAVLAAVAAVARSRRVTSLAQWTGERSGHRRRRGGTQRIDGCSRAREGRASGPGARSGRHTGRWHPLQRTAAARRDPRRVLGDPPVGARLAGVPQLADDGSLAANGLDWMHPTVPLAHPLDHGGAVVLQRSVDDTAGSSAPMPPPIAA
jgi:HAMP domain-containing protein